MKKEFWHARWANGEIGFHQSEYTPLLVKYGPSLFRPGERVLVPFCGKTKDLLWLRDAGASAIGVELSGLAIEAFLSETGVTASRAQARSYVRYQTDGIELYEGDLFGLTPEDVGRVDAVFDRAALIALPADMRRAYADHICKLLRPTGRMLLVALEYDSPSADAPPFSVDSAEVERLYGTRATIELLERRDVLSENVRFIERGIQSLYESAHRITLR